jgi:hypothetical protein
MLGYGHDGFDNCVAQLSLVLRELTFVFQMIVAWGLTLFQTQ